MSTFSANLVPLASGHCKAQSLASTSSVPGSGGWVLLNKGARAYAVVAATGAVGGGSVVYKVQSASDANGTGAADVYAGLITHTVAGSVTVAEIRAENVPSAKPYVAIVATTTGTNLASASLVALDPAYVS